MLAMESNIIQRRRTIINPPNTAGKRAAKTATAPPRATEGITPRSVEDGGRSWHGAFPILDPRSSILDPRLLLVVGHLRAEARFLLGIRFGWLFLVGQAVFYDLFQVSCCAFEGAAEVRLAVCEAPAQGLI